MRAKITNNQVERFPYGVGDLRSDHPATSFPKSISDEIWAEFGAQNVVVGAIPDYDPMVQTAVADALPTEEAGLWVLNHVVQNRQQEVAETNVRNHRDGLLQKSDWIAIKSYERGENIPAEWEIYRQSLRDITAQEGFPWSVTWPTKPGE